VHVLFSSGDISIFCLFILEEVAGIVLSSSYKNYRVPSDLSKTVKTNKQDIKQ